MFECVINVSEGRDRIVLDQLADACRGSLRDLHSDREHHRSVFTLIDDAPALSVSVRALIDACFAHLDLRRHKGVHPRFGVLDVVPYVALEPTRRDVARRLRDDTGQWIADTYDVPVFYYGAIDGELRTLPEVRRLAFHLLDPDAGPDEPSERLGAVAVGERPVMLAWNLWLSGTTLERARELATAVRQGAVRALGFAVRDLVQVSCNLIDPLRVGPDLVYDDVARRLRPGERIDHAELVGLCPREVLEAIDPQRWSALGLSEATTIEARLG